MKTSNLIFIVLVAVIAGFILRTIVIPCNPAIPGSDTTHIERTVYDTIFQDVPVPVKIVRIDTIIKPVTVYKLQKQAIDTAFIIAEWNKLRIYDDVLKDDSTGYIRLAEKVSYNKIHDRTLYFESRCRDRVITNTIHPTGFYMIGSVMTSKGMVGAGGGIMYLSHQSRLYSLNIGYLDKPYVGFSYGIKF